MSEDPLDRDDPARMPLPSAVNHTHATAPDLLQDFVISEMPLGVRHVRFGEHAFESFRGSFALGLQSLFEKTVYASLVAETHGGTAPLAFARAFLHARN